jgi:hypothetical protein
MNDWVVLWRGQKGSSRVNICFRQTFAEWADREVPMPEGWWTNRRAEARRRREELQAKWDGYEISDKLMRRIYHAPHR